MDLTILIVALGIFLGFFVHTMIGFAGALIALPILLTVMNMPDAISIISIFYLLSSIYLVYKEWNNIDKMILQRLLFISIIGISIGVYVLTFSKPVFLRRLLGVFVFLYVVYSYFKQNNEIKNPRYTLPLGLLGGFFSGLFSTGGPLYVMSVRSSASDIKAFRATMIGVLGMISVIRVPVLSIGGVLTKTHLMHSIVIIPFFLLSQFLGKKAYGMLNEATFKQILLLLLLFSSFMLMLKS
ncbi:sulfite exporter TauE/SafE family protein [Membranihabitans maritimus]|uniref:sulfite exporter TauE/SafE family protein n=1 Tax=Membranihabitans maritimus TaxID=2904244 RepID=UPI001F228D17|nr:sulfite exporter TauE/SafE family protein [Membranihabitans maritimus]